MGNLLNRIIVYTFMVLYLCGAAAAQNFSAVPGSSIIDPFNYRPVFVENFSTVDPAAQARLKSWLLLGSEGHWRGHLNRSIYHLSNSTAPNEANYLITVLNHQGASGRIAEVQVKTDLRRGTVHSGAGLIYGGSSSGDTFQAFVIQSNGQYSLIKKDHNGFHILQTGQSHTGRPYVFNSLAVRTRSENTVDLFINSNRVATVNEPGVGLQGDGIGLLAISTGYFSFGALTVALPNTAFDRSGGLDRYGTPKSGASVFPDSGFSKQGPAQKPIGRTERSPSGPVAKKANGEIVISSADVNMAKSMIKSNTMTIPGMAGGSSIKMGPGNFSAADALVIYMVKFHRRYKVCPPIAVMARALTKIQDTNYAKKAASVFWKEYSTSSGHSSLPETFEWYLNTKATEKHKISNMRLQGYVGAGEAWNRAMNSQRKSWEKSTQRRDEYILKRGAYRVILNAQAAVAAAESAIR